MGARGRAFWAHYLLCRNTHSPDTSAPLASKLALAQLLSRFVAQLKQERSVGCGSRRAYKAARRVGQAEVVRSHTLHLAI